MTKHSSGMSRVAVIGLDCAEPSLVFDDFAQELPNLSHLRSEGTFGRLRSVVPCITVPAWACMMSSRDPGQLGIYGFHNRTSYAYGRLGVANAASLDVPLLWDLLGAAGKKVVLVGVPPSYPPRPVKGYSVGCFLTPSVDREYTYPASLADEIRATVGEYLVDCPNFRTNDKAYLLQQIYDMTNRRLDLMTHLANSKPWDFFMSVEIGVDRIHHGFWRYHDPGHPKFVEGNPYRDAIRDYYRHLDRRLGEFLKCLGPETAVWVLSDHGATRMEGGFCLNDWLVERGYLVLRNAPEPGTPIDKCDVEWSRTKAWGGGGYYGRVFLNVVGREPHGTIAPADYEAFRTALAAEIEGLADPAGRPMGNRVFRPQDIYRDVRGIPPDLIVYFGDLSWRAVGTVGHASTYTTENDTGPDDANHAQHGLFICRDPRSKGRGLVEGAQLVDVAPTILRQMELPVPPEMIGKALPLN